MKKIAIIILVLVVFLVIVWQFNNNPAIILARLENKAKIKQGDLVFRINLFGIIPVGQAVFSREKLEFYNGQEVYHLSAVAQPLNIYSALFKGSAAIDSYVDKGKLKPIFFKQRVNSPGKESPQKDIFYDIEKNTMTLRGVTREILPNTFDPLSIMFNLKNMDFSKVKNLDMNINTNQKNYSLKGQVSEKGLIRSYKSYLVRAQIKRRENDPYHRSNVTIVFIKDSQNIPLLIRVFASGALITAKLVDIQQ